MQVQKKMMLSEACLRVVCVDSGGFRGLVTQASCAGSGLITCWKVSQSYDEMRDGNRRWKVTISEIVLYISK